MSKVRKAVIPAAGHGTRFLPATKAQPKEMLPVVDKPVIQYVVEEAAASGIEDILIITGRGKRAVEDHFDFNIELAQQLKSADVEARRTAARALGEMGNEAETAIPLLGDAVGDEDAEVRRLASYALGGMGPAARPALPALNKALEDQELSVRLSAAFAVQKIAPETETHVPVLVHAMQMGEGGVIVSVGDMGEKAAWAVPTLVSLLKDRRPGIRRLAAEALGRIGPAESAAEAALRAAARDGDDRVREAAQQALEAIRRAPVSDDG